MKESNDQNILEKVKNLRGGEREIVAELVSALSKIYTKRLYLEAGYPSLYAFCTSALGYSSGAAWRRCAAAKVVLKTPEVLNELRNGELNLCAVAELSKVLNDTNRERLLEGAKGKSKEEVQMLVARHQPIDKPARRVERVRIKRSVPSKTPLLCASSNSCAEPKAGSADESAQNRDTVTLELTQAEMDLIKQAQVVLSTAKVKDTLLKSASKVVQHRQRLEQVREKRANKTEKKPCASPVRKLQLSSPNCTKKPSRYIPADVRHAVEKRDGGRCSYVAPDGTRCCEARNLEFDHRVPFALGGESTVENLRLVCRGHNRLYADNVFGREWIEQVVARSA